MTEERETMTGAEVAELLGISESMIWKWKHRHQLTPAGLLRGQGRGGQVPLYRVEDVRPLAAAYLERRARRAETRSSEKGQA